MPEERTISHPSINDHGCQQYKLTAPHSAPLSSAQKSSVVKVLASPKGAYFVEPRLVTPTQAQTLRLPHWPPVVAPVILDVYQVNLQAGEAGTVRRVRQVGSEGFVHLLHSQVPKEADVTRSHVGEHSAAGIACIGSGLPNLTVVDDGR